MNRSFRSSRSRWARPTFLLLSALAIASPVALPGLAPQEPGPRSGATPWEVRTLPTGSEPRDPAVDPGLLDGLRWRMVGPHRGGRVTAVAGFPGRPHDFLQGTTGGGVWHTDDAGHHWHPIADDALTVGNIGAIAVADSDPDRIYVGTGSACIRGNVSIGRGIWRSSNGGATWAFAGLPESGAIGEIVVHPRNPDLVYVAALGSPFGRNEERGVYRSRDGGANWERVLFLSDSTGAVSLAMNPEDPEEIFAGMWRAERKPWTLTSGSLDGGLYRSRDGGESWTKLGGGLPQGLVGRVGVSISPANPRRVWAMIEAQPGNGLWRSDDGGETWRFLNGDEALAGRAWYYHHVVADPVDPDRVYVLNVRFHRSDDGGENFTMIPVPHGDVHDLWIHPEDPEVMVLGDDGGAVVTLNGGRTWSTMYNQPTAELYDVMVDHGIPYRIYGSQQDNTTISVPSVAERNQLRPQEGWRYAAGCETGPIAFDPDDPDVVWGGCYGGVINRMVRSTDTRRNVNLRPENTSVPVRDLANRFQWVAPIVVSPHDPETVYHASQYVHRTRDGGMSWETISPDLSWNDPSVQGFPGGPIHADHSGVEVFGTVFALAVSPHHRETLWAGTDDGRVWITRDEGARWIEITPPDLPRWATVNRIELSAQSPGRAFLAVHRYRLNDPAPYLWRTDDYGESWTPLADGSNGIPSDHWVRVIREDPVQRGLLYAGTEFGVFVSFDDGVRWQRLRGNLPASPVTDLKVHRGDLVISTQGRSFWVLDDVTSLRALAVEVASGGPVGERPRLFAPRDAARGWSNPPLQEVDLTFPDGLPPGALLFYTLPATVGAARLEIEDASGRPVFSRETGIPGPRTLEAGGGIRRVSWDLRHAGSGVKAPPGHYRVRLRWGAELREVEEQSLRVTADPRDPSISQADYEEQFRVSLEVADTIQVLRAAIERLRAERAGVDRIVAEAEADGRANAIDALARRAREGLDQLEGRLASLRRTDGPAGVRTEAGLDRQYATLFGYLNGTGGYGPGTSEGRPTQGAFDRKEELDREWRTLSAELERLIEGEIAALRSAAGSSGSGTTTSPPSAPPPPGRGGPEPPL